MVSQVIVAIEYEEMLHKISLEVQKRAVHGGLIKEDIVDDQTKFPILGDLPILEKFFSYTAKTVNKTDLMFFITVTVLEDPNIIGVYDEVAPDA